MADVHGFCRDENDLIDDARNLKLRPCPHCNTVGMPIRNGWLRGFDETRRQKVVRARRVFCSNRNRRGGCMSRRFAELLRILEYPKFEPSSNQHPLQGPLLVANLSPQFPTIRQTLLQQHKILTHQIRQNFRPEFGREQRVGMRQPTDSSGEMQSPSPEHQRPGSNRDGDIVV